MGSPGHLKTFDYTGLHRYFLTFCTDKRRHLFVSSGVRSNSQGFTTRRGSAAVYGSVMDLSEYFGTTRPRWLSRSTFSRTLSGLTLSPRQRSTRSWARRFIRWQTFLPPSARSRIRFGPAEAGPYVRRVRLQPDR